MADNRDRHVPRDPDRVYTTGPVRGKNPARTVTRAASWKRKVEEIRTTARFGGFPISDDVHPVDVLTDELKRSTAFCAWIESHMAQWDDALVPLSEGSYDDKGAIHSESSEAALWLAVWQSERKHLATVAKMCIDAGVSERQIQLAEAQTKIMIGLIDKAFEALELSGEQKSRIPQIMPKILRSMAMPGAEE